MLKKQFFILAAFLVISSISFGQSRHSKTSMFKSYKGLVMAGYQGWFNTPEDGTGRGWRHYGGARPGSVSIDLWPETSELPKTYKTAFAHADGSPAYLPSANDASTVAVHFKWMKEYGLDGVFMQRFVAEIRNPSGKNHFNKVLQSAMTYSKKYNRAISVMYDFSGMSDNDIPTVINDWKNLVDSMKITSQGNKQTYLYHNNKPLVVLWGVGFNDNRRYTLKGVEKIIDFLKTDPEYGGCSVMLGVPTYWREFGNDTMKDTLLHDLIRKADIVHPWTVGRYGTIEAYNRYAQVQKGDIEWCKQNKVDYVAVMYPGFSWYNMKHRGNPNTRFDQIPRNRGQFLWAQIKGAVNNGAEMIYFSMFDEVDEGTAIFKISKNPPVGESRFVKFEDDIPSDYYLYLAGYAKKLLNKKKPVTENPPPPKSSTKSL